MPASSQTPGLHGGQLASSGAEAPRSPRHLNGLLVAVLRLCRELSELVQINHAQRAVFGSVQIDARYAQDTDPSRFVGLVGLEPSRSAEAPLAPARQTGRPQIIAPGGTEVEKLVRHDARDGVVAGVHDTVGQGRAAVPITKETRGRGRGEVLQGLAEYIETGRHF